MQSYGGPWLHSFNVGNISRHLLPAFAASNPSPPADLSSWKGEAAKSIMGIPRLQQDLLPYGERVVFGSSSRLPPENLRTNNLIIDGPSLVYFVHNKLLAFLSLNCVTSATRTPTYDEINRGLYYILDDFENLGIRVQHIFFDGGLPVSKHEIRLGRMEKLRQQLEGYRRLNPEFPSFATSSPIRDFEAAFWGTATTSAHTITLPPPPFMVASAIESLCSFNSRWKRRVHVVPGEADVYCAIAARHPTTVAHVLTNDSDLAIHDLGDSGRVALLHSLAKSTQWDGTHLTVLCLNPSEIAARLDLPSLLPVGFERSLDPSVPFAVVRGRARELSRLARLQHEYHSFLAEFRPSDANIGRREELQLHGVDPRTAEVIVGAKDFPHNYLTPSHEDPDRESPWSYGIETRQLAYSLLFHTIGIKDKDAGVTEHLRKGQRISTTVVPIFGHVDIRKRATDLRELLTAYFPQPTGQAPSTENPATLLRWFTLSIHLLCAEKLGRAKPTPTLSEITHLLNISSSSKIPTRSSWSDVHLLSDIHTILYSLRMLQQIITWILRNPTSPTFSNTSPALTSANDRHLITTTHYLHAFLSQMPPISELFLDLPQLRRKIPEIDVEARYVTIWQLEALLKTATEYGEGMGVRIPREEAFSLAPAIGGEVQWTQTKAKKRRNRKRKQEVVANSGSVRSENLFGLLSDEAG